MSVLGKRTRSCLPSVQQDFVELPLPSRKRTRASPKSKRHDNAFEIHQDGDNVGIGERMDVDDLAESVNQGRKSRRDPLSPSKGDTSRETLPAASDFKPEQHIRSPQTPRHRDALSKKNPITPRHRVRVSGAPLTPRTPRTPQGISQRTHQPCAIYLDAKRCFFGNVGDEHDTRKIIGRGNERDELRQFISTRAQDAKGGGLYVSGPPGTGKSALIGEVTRELTLPSDVKHAYINCMSIKSANEVYSTLLSELEISDNMFDAKSKHTLAQAITSKKKDQATFLVVLDEIDALLNVDVEVLYNMFDWALNASSRMILIGIANALDLTDRFLPNLRARGLKPQLLPFLPYTPSDISSVLTARLRTLLPEGSTTPESFTPILMPPAIQLISKKVAAQTGDLRKAFDIAQKAIAVIEAEAKEQLQQQQHQQDSCNSSPSKAPLGENTNLSSPRSTSDSPHKPQKTVTASMSSFTAETAPRASISHVVRVTSATFSNGTKERLLALNLQQKAVLCALAALEQRNQRSQESDTSLCDLLAQPRTGLLPSPTATPSKKRVRMTPSTPTKRETGSAPRIREVYEAYASLCTRENMLSALTYSEFRDVVGNLETMGLLSAADGKLGSFVQVTTPSRKGRGNTGMNSTSMDERRVHGTAGVDELKASLESAGAVKAILVRMLEGRDL